METDAHLTARLLLEIGAVHIRPEQPFTLTSGTLSPVYVDCRKVISFPRARRLIVAAMARQTIERIGAEAIDIVAGGETAGIPYAAWLADTLGLPMIYVRKKPKGFGRNAQIEGVMAEGARVLLVEDLASEGTSKLAFVEALRAAGAICHHTQVVFFYAAFAGGLRTLADAGIALHALATWDDVLTVASADRLLPDAAIGEVRAFLADTAGWSKAR